jgi:peptidyl-dipeptidase A
MKKAIISSLLFFLTFSCINKDEMVLKEIISQTETSIYPLYVESSNAYWNGTISGDPKEFAKYSEANIALTKIYSDSLTFNKLKTIRERGSIKDSILMRQLDVLYNLFLANQADTLLLEEIINKSTILETKYAEFRAQYQGKKISDNEVELLLQTSTNNRDLEDVWNAHKEIGQYVAQDVLDVIRLRNKLARSLGYNNYHTMSLELSGQNPQDISALFDELDSLTKGEFKKLKDEMDVKFSKRYGVDIEKLMPWHYQGRYFQESPKLYPVDLDKYYKGRNLEQLTTDFYSSIGLDVTTIMANSDLYEKVGKNQHAYCIDIDTKGDVRVLANISDNEAWMGTMLHEFGHGVYSLGHDIPSNPFFLKNAAHAFTTEAVAMIFGRLSRNPEWMKQSLKLSDEEKKEIEDDCYNSLKLQQLVFSRWVQVVYRFEKDMYSNPEQDLNSLWWDLVEKYQMLNKPEGRNMPDWATKVHLALYPCYYHNYQLGELLASQMHYYITDNITNSGDYRNECYIGNLEVGKWMSDNVFQSGMKYEWNDMIKKATGEKLTAKYFAMQFVD